MTVNAQSSAPHHRMLQAIALVAILFAAPTVRAQDAHPPALLHVLFGNQVALQALDGYLTVRALERQGVREQNAVMRPFVQSPVAVLAVKSAAAAVVVGVSAQLWRGGHRKAAMASMLASNLLMSVVVNRNAAVVRARGGR
jgi:hypothetical protein